MKKTLLLSLGLLASAFLSVASAGDKSYPAKDPVLTYSEPEGWTTTVSEKDGSISVNPKDGRISVNFGEAPAEATMELFEKMLPEMAKTLTDAKQVEAPKEHTEDGLTGYTATYTAKIDGKPAMAIMILFKGGKDRAIIGNVIVTDPENLPKEDDAALGEFMKSLKGATK